MPGDAQIFMGAGMSGGGPVHETPIDPDEEAGLLIPQITTRAELNYWEQNNITEALRWLAQRRPKNILTVSFMRKLHRKMFGEVWAWAGEFRKTEKNIGVPVWSIAAELKKLCDDADFWIKNRVYSPDEAAARFHHRLTWIHPFPNGNGRHARLMTDILLKDWGVAGFSWGSTDLGQKPSFRKRYVAALRAADAGDFKLLLDFVRT